MIPITKKESLFLSVYHTVWMLHKAKTARLVITLYRHITDKLPTSYRHITNCRPTVGRLSADCRPTDSLCFGENLSAICQPSVGQQTANSRPTDGRQSANRRPTVGQQTADRQPTDGRQSTDSRPTGFLGSSSSQLLTNSSILSSLQNLLMENGYIGLHLTRGLLTGLTICYIVREF